MKCFFAGYDSFSNESWNLKLVDYIKKVLADPRVRVIGVCYGHQIIGRALGISVGRSNAGWEISATAMDLTEVGKTVFGQDTLVCTVVILTLALSPTAVSCCTYA